MNQAQQAVRYMRLHGPLTRQIAFMSLDIANLTAVISDARQAGAIIKMVEKVDPKGRTYASYRMG